MCPRYEPLLPKHAEGTLSEFESLSVTLHLDRCEDCRTVYNGLVRDQSDTGVRPLDHMTDRDIWLRERMSEVQKRKSGWDDSKSNWVIRQWRAASGPVKAVTIGTACALAVVIPAWVTHERTPVEAASAQSPVETKPQAAQAPAVPEMAKAEPAPAAAVSAQPQVPAVAAAAPPAVKPEPAAAPPVTRAVAASAPRRSVASAVRIKGTPRRPRPVTARPVSPTPAIPAAPTVFASRGPLVEPLAPAKPVVAVESQPVQRQFAVITGIGSEPMLIAVGKPAMPPPVYTEGSVRPKAMYAVITGATPEPILVKVASTHSAELMAASE